MKLLLDQNLSQRILPLIADLYPGSLHVKQIGLREADDEEVWWHAVRHGFVIVSKDSDFHQRSLVRGHPPKVVYLRLGNCPTRRVVEVLQRECETLRQFEVHPTEAMLVLG